MLVLFLPFLDVYSESFITHTVLGLAIINLLELAWVVKTLNQPELWLKATHTKTDTDATNGL